MKQERPNQVRTLSLHCETAKYQHEENKSGVERGCVGEGKNAPPPSSSPNIYIHGRVNVYNTFGFGCTSIYNTYNMVQQ